MISILLALFLLVSCDEILVKHLAGPAEEFPLHRIPEPAIVIERSSSINLWFSAPDRNGLISSTVFPVDGKEQFAISFSSPVAPKLKIELLRDGVPLPKSTYRIIEGTFEVGDGSSNEIPMVSYLVSGVIDGFYQFNLYTNELFVENDLDALMANPRPDGVLNFLNNDDMKIHSHLQSYLIKVGSEVGLVSNLVDETNANSHLDMVIVRAVMEVISPDGAVSDFVMKDDGLHGDLLANDGVYGATFQATQPGEFILKATMDGALSNIPFQRSTQHVVVVSTATVEVEGSATLRQINPSRVGIDIELTNTDKAQPRIRAYAEVSGTDAHGNTVPACWIGGVVEIAGKSIELELDLHWLSRLGLKGPITLTNVIINDLTTNFPIDDETGIIKVTDSENIVFNFDVAMTDITHEMRVGVNPLPPINKTELAASPNLLLLPGYCSDVNPFSAHDIHFNNGFFPVDKGNYGNDQYARKMKEKVDQQRMDSFGVIGHSQGGMVATHLQNYYWSGMDRAQSGRLIQSVGTPFQGCTAAGGAANLGNVFGVGCGSNPDLSLDGAKNWLAGISTVTRKHVHFYTSTYQQGNLFGDWCSFPMNLLLQWPNDGVTESQYAPLPGAVNCGNTQKYCHSVDMTYPPLTQNANVNKEMNKLAAR